MVAATYILFVLGCLGAIDIAIYHTFAHGIRSHPDSRRELLVHSLRGPTYATLFLVIPNLGLHGLFFWFLIGLFVADVAISIADFALERDSRSYFGGLPSGEYILHILIAMFFGALVTAVFFEAIAWASLPTSLTYDPAPVHILLRLVMAVMAVVVLVSGVQDLVAAQRLRGQSPRTHAISNRGSQTTPG
jgi:hypothetical protein